MAEEKKKKKKLKILVPELRLEMGEDGKVKEKIRWGKPLKSTKTKGYTE